MRATPTILAVLLFTLAAPSWAQAPARIAWIWPTSAASAAANRSAFNDGMRDNGMVEGKQYVLDERFADGKYERFPALTEELLKHNPAIIMVVTIASVREAQRATKTIPIVFVSTNDPVGSGLIASLARPGGNTTGLSNQTEDITAKHVELLREVLWRAKRVAVLVNPGNPSNPKIFEQVHASAGAFGIAARAFEATSPAALDSAFSAIAEHRPDALLVSGDAMFFDQRDRISTFALRQRILTFADQQGYAASGSLIAYGTPRRELYRRAATYVKKILAGAKPADLPVEQPTKFELVINLKTAKAIGITIPQSLLQRADEVIE